MRADLDLTSVRGLSADEAAARLAAEGPNALPDAKSQGLFAIALSVLREPMFLLLLGCGALYLVLGDLKEALVLLGFVVVMIAITIIQERRTERAVEALRDLSSPRALVVRDGVATRIAGRDVVRGDVVVLAEGDRVPADATVLQNAGLSVDESLLTGESVPVRKRARDPGVAPSAARPGGDDTPGVYSGSLVVKGRAIAEVTTIGAHTELGKIGKALADVETEKAPLAREIARLVRRVAIIGAALCILVAVVYGVTRHDWLRGVLAGITLAMAMLPEEFPVVLTVFLAIGAWRMSQRRVLTRRSAAIETLGSASVLCVDKTGTLTENRMTVVELRADGERIDPAAAADLPETFHALVEYAILASQRDPFDPMEVAIVGVGTRHLTGTEHLHEAWTMVREYPLSRELLALSQVWTSPDGTDYVIAAKGAPEAIGDLCHLDAATTATLHDQVSDMASRGLRVLAVARARFSQAEGLPGEQHDFAFELIGLLGLADPVRAEVPAAVKAATAAGVRVVMITGDYPETARSIARSVGLARTEDVMTGPELAAGDPATLAARVGLVDIFARVVPEQKLALVRALSAGGAIVAMTGDGVNDAPALKAAHIGIAMGARGTDVAREASAIVLVDDDFGSIVAAIALGRRIFDNLRRAMAYIIAVHVPIAGMSLIPVLLGWPIVLHPVHVVFLELVIDPACSIAFEAEPGAPGLMTQPPRPPDEPVVRGLTLAMSLLQGTSALAATCGVFAWALPLGEDHARALSFATLIASNVGLILVNRSWTASVFATLRVPNRAAAWVVLGALVVLVAGLEIPALRTLFRFADTTVIEQLVAVSIGFASALWFEIWKVARRPAVAVTLEAP
jgi:Ca2+-transporting ATPase